MLLVLKHSQPFLLVVISRKRHCIHCAENENVLASEWIAVHSQKRLLPIASNTEALLVQTLGTIQFTISFGITGVRTADFSTFSKFWKSSLYESLIY